MSTAVARTCESRSPSSAHSRSNVPPTTASTTSRPGGPPYRGGNALPHRPTPPRQADPSRHAATPGQASSPAAQARQGGGRLGPSSSRGGTGKRPPGPPDPILFQQWFRSVGPRTYAAQIKKARNQNQYLVLTEGKRDGKTNDVRKISLYVYSEDFPEFLRLLDEVRQYIQANPMPEHLSRKRLEFWKKGGPKKERRQTENPAAAPG
jgi:Protein of unknown function (DUF3276)